MPKKARELTALAVSKLSAEGRYAVGGVDGLYLYIRNKSRSWVFRWMVGTRQNSQGETVSHRRDMGLGCYPLITLAEAREKARMLRKQVMDGGDPLGQRRQARAVNQAKAKTFRECAQAVITNKARVFKNARSARQWQSSLETYAYPLIGNMYAADITKTDIAAILTPIWESKHTTASRLRERMEAVLDYAKAMECREGENPAAWKGTLEPILGRVRSAKKPQPSLPYAEIGRFLTQLRQQEGIAPRALEFIILTATRAGEVFAATWDEIDLESKVWTIPAERMKADKPHRVPLSGRALDILQKLPRMEGTSYVFPAIHTKHGRLYDVTIGNIIKRLHHSDLKNGGNGFNDPKQDRIATTHGFRSTFRDWAAEQTSFPREVCEHALAHKLPDAVEAAYLRTDYLEKRTRLMEEWAEFCNRLAISKSL